MWFTCVCNKGSHLSHGYWDVRLRLFKVFLVHKKGGLRLTYHKRVPGLPEHILRDSQPHPRDIERQLKEAGSVLEMDELTAKLQQTTFKQEISDIQQALGKYLPQGLFKCPFCDQNAPSLRERLPASCGYVSPIVCYLSLRFPGIMPPLPHAFS
jgi:hypothetical protein